MEPHPPSPQTIPLQYAAAPSRWRRRARKILLATTLLITTCLLWRYGPYAWRQSQLLYWQHQCMNYSARPDTVVYEEDPHAAAALLRLSPEYAPFTLQRDSDYQKHLPPVQAAKFCPRCLTKLLQRSNLPISQFLAQGGRLDAVIFLHELTSPCGHRRLVWITYAQRGSDFTWTFLSGYPVWPSVMLPATWKTPIAYAPYGVYAVSVPGAYFKKPPLLRIYAGQPDPADPSHFTIRYQMWGQQDILDGRLDDTDHVYLKPRKNPPGWPQPG